MFTCPFRLHVLVLEPVKRVTHRHRAHGSNRQLTASGAARLARLESIANKQARSLAEAEKQLEKLQIRVRLKNQDVLPLVTQVSSPVKTMCDTTQRFRPLKSLCCPEIGTTHMLGP